MQHNKHLKKTAFREGYLSLKTAFHLLPSFFLFLIHEWDFILLGTIYVPKLYAKFHIRVFRIYFFLLFQISPSPFPSLFRISVRTFHRIFPTRKFR